MPDETPDKTADQLSPSDSRILDRCIADLRTACGNRLLAVCLTGEAATGDYRPGRSPLALAVLVDRISPDMLRATARVMRRRHWRRAGVPLLLDRLYIDTSLDVFPLEFLDLADRHRTLIGEDPFVDLRVDTPHLRMEVEERLRGKLLHLWEAYLRAAGSRRALRALLVESPAEFEVALRGLLRLQHENRPDEALGLIAQIEKSFAVELPTLRRLEQAHAGAEALNRSELEPLFDGYLDEVRRLVRLADAL